MTTPSSATVYAFDWDSRSFWPMAMANEDHDANSIVQFEPLGSATKSDVIIGCADGYVRHFDQAVYQDDSDAFTSYVVLGPFDMGGVVEGLVTQLYGCLPTESGDVNWSILAGTTGENAVGGAAKASGTWVAGLNTTERPMVRASYACLKLANGESNDGWTVEEIDMVFSATGRRG